MPPFSDHATYSEVIEVTNADELCERIEDACKAQALLDEGAELKAAFPIAETAGSIKVVLIFQKR